MLSRGECKSQLFILEKLPQDKIYPDKEALKELERMHQVSLNNHLTSWDEIATPVVLKVSFLNTRSIKNKFACIKTDEGLRKSNIIILCETWLEKDENVSNIILEDYMVSHCGGGRGQRMVTFYQNNFFSTDCNADEHLNIMKFGSNALDIIGVYSSPKGNPSKIIDKLKSLVNMSRPTLIMGVFNICLINNKDNPVTKFLKSKGFIQLVKSATHIEVRGYLEINSCCIYYFSLRVACLTMHTSLTSVKTEPICS